MLTKAAEAIAKPLPMAAVVLPARQSSPSVRAPFPACRAFSGAVGVVRDGAVGVDGEAHRDGTEHEVMVPSMTHRSPSRAIFSGPMIIGNCCKHPFPISIAATPTDFIDQAARV